jgi:hypothetical protein
MKKTIRIMIGTKKEKKNKGFIGVLPVLEYMAFDMPKKRYSYKQAMKYGVWK